VAGLRCPRGRQIHLPRQPIWHDRHRGCRLFERLGRVAAAAAGIVVIGSLVTYHAEHPTNPQFATVGDSLWWGTVTLTTVGYGDIVPKTTTGRWVAVTIMVTGIAVLGLLAGSLASFFRLDVGKPASDSPATGEPVSTVGPSSDPALRALAAEVSGLRQQVAELTERLTGTPPTQVGRSPEPVRTDQADRK
jgi:voltage-gated potassium channel